MAKRRRPRTVGWWLLVAIATALWLGAVAWAVLAVVTHNALFAADTILWGVSGGFTTAAVANKEEG